LAEFFDKDLLQLFRRSQQYLCWPLLLRRFIERTKAWAHFDIHAWTPKAKPGRPEGAEVLAARLHYDLIEARFRTGTSAEPSEAKGHKFVRRAKGPSAKVVPPTTLYHRRLGYESCRAAPVF